MEDEVPVGVPVEVRAGRLRLRGAKAGAQALAAATNQATVNLATVNQVHPGVARPPLMVTLHQDQDFLDLDQNHMATLHQGQGFPAQALPGAQENMVPAPVRMATLLRDQDYPGQARAHMVTHHQAQDCRDQASVRTDTHPQGLVYPGLVPVHAIHHQAQDFQDQAQDRVLTTILHNQLTVPAATDLVIRTTPILAYIITLMRHICQLTTLHRSTCMSMNTEIPTAVLEIF